MRVDSVVERDVGACVRGLAHGVLHGDGREVRVLLGGDALVL